MAKWGSFGQKNTARTKMQRIRDFECNGGKEKLNRNQIFTVIVTVETFKV